mgnify:CR=1 FL=1
MSDINERRQCADIWHTVQDYIQIEKWNELSKKLENADVNKLTLPGAISWLWSSSWVQESVVCGCPCRPVR